MCICCTSVNAVGCVTVVSQSTITSHEAAAADSDVHFTDEVRFVLVKSWN